MAERNIRARACGVFRRGSEALLIRLHNPDTGWTRYITPGGGMVYGESSEDAVRREMREELGVEVSDAHYVGAFEDLSTTSEGFLSHSVSLVYEVSTDDQAFYDQEEVVVDDTAATFVAVWRRIADLVSDHDAVGQGLRSVLSSMMCASAAEGEEAGAYELPTTPMPASDLIAEYWRHWAAPLRRDGIAITVDARDCPVSAVAPADARWLAQAFGNIRSNAVKAIWRVEQEEDYAHEASDAAVGGIHVRVRAVGQDLEITVSDTGHGIPAGRLDDVLHNRWSKRTRPVAREVRGMQLIRHAMSELGGDVTIASEENVGTTVRLRMPIQELAAR